MRLVEDVVIHSEEMVIQSVIHFSGSPVPWVGDLGIGNSGSIGLVKIVFI